MYLFLHTHLVNSGNLKNLKIVSGSLIKGRVIVRETLGVPQGPVV